MQTLARTPKLLTKALSFAALLCVLGLPLTTQAGSKVALLSKPRPVSFSVLCSHPNHDFDSRRLEACQVLNTIREWHMAAPLKLDPDLSETAQNLAHEPPTALVLPKIESGVAEALTAVVEDPSEAIRDWMSKSNNRKNLLHKKFHRLGVGVAQNHWVILMTD